MAPGCILYSALAAHEGYTVENHTSALEPERGEITSNDSAASSDVGSVVRYRLEAGEVEWEIVPGRKVRGYGFNGQVPGPVLEARQGVPLEIEFTNRLPEPTVIHWHGLRIPAAMDGIQVVQRLIEPGETYTYRFTPPDAGTFWYHPHHNETEQLEKALWRADRPRRRRTGARRRGDPGLRRFARR